MNSQIAMMNEAFRQQPIEYINQQDFEGGLMYGDEVCW